MAADGQLKLTHNVYGLLVQEKRRRLILEEQLRVAEETIRKLVEDRLAITETFYAILGQLEEAERNGC